MKKIFLYFAALTAVAVACRKVDIEPQGEADPEPEVEMVTETITGSRGASTKVTIDDTSGAFAWTATNDLVAVHVNNGTYVTSSGASESAKSATFDVTYPSGATRDAFAVFPSSIVAADAANYGQEGHTLDVTLPSSYTLAQVSGETSPCPMIATNDPSSSEWSFKQLCGLLRLTVNGIPSDATGLVIQFPGKKVNGSFAIASPVTPESSSISTGASADGEDKISVTFDAGITSATVNIPLPTGDYEDVYITPVGSATKVAAARFIKAGGYTAARARAKKLTTTMVSFSVSDTKKVFFSPGNLIKTDATHAVGSGNETYAFETMPFNTNGGSLGYSQGTPTSTSARGYFTWYEIISDGATSESPRVFSVGEVSNWRAMTYDECDYLLWSRDMNGGAKRFYRIDLGSDQTQLGLLVPPDEATSDDVDGLNGGTGLSPTGFTQNVDVDTYISRGFVFLPAVGLYIAGSENAWFRNVNYKDDTRFGYYWLTTEEDDDWAYWLYTHASGQSNDDSYWKYYYCSVRLVHE